MFSLRTNTYVTGVNVPSAWLNGIATDLSRAIDGTNGSGGTPYTPGTVIILGGSGLHVTGDFQASSCSSIDLVSGAITCESGSKFTAKSGSTCEFKGATEHFGTSTEVYDSGAACTFNGGSTAHFLGTGVGATCTFDSGSHLNLNGAVACTGASITSDGTTLATLDGVWSMTGAVGVSGSFEVSGKDLHVTTIDLSDGDHTLDLATGGQRIRMLTAPAANRILTLRQSSTNTPPDDYWFEITVFNANTHGHTVGLQRQGSLDYVAVLGTGVVSVDGIPASVRVVKRGGVWKFEWAGGGSVFSGADA